MKNFKKENNLFICEECGRTFIKIDGLSKHINLNHKGTKDYYDKWLRENDEGLCVICGNPTEFSGFKNFYKNCCSKECTKQHRSNQTQKTLMQKYKVNAPAKNKKIREKINKTMEEKYGSKCPMMNFAINEKIKNNCIEKLGVEYPFQSSQIQQKIIQSNLKNYGVENAFQRKDVKIKIEKTCIERFGVSNPNKNKEIRNKIEKTCIERYGVKNPSQNNDIHEKQQKNACYAKKYKNTNLYYRSSYELDFLEKFYEIYSDIQNGPSIRYVYNGENKIYFSDFYIPSLNLIVECKNSYLAKKDEEKIKAKEKATIANGFEYIMIIDKCYRLFSKYSINSPS